MTESSEQRQEDRTPPARPQAVAVLPEAPLISAAGAKQQWEEYQELKDAVLGEEDFLWFAEWEEWEADKQTGKTRKKVKRASFGAKAEAQREALKRHGQVSGRMVKSACRKMAKFFGIEIPAQGQGQSSRHLEGNYIVSVERGDRYTYTEWLDAKSLRTIKASTTVFIISPSGRTWMGKGGSHESEGFAEDFAIGQTAFTRAVNRAILDLVGWGEETVEETRVSESRPGEYEEGPPTPVQEDAQQGPPKAAQRGQPQPARAGEGTLPPSAPATPQVKARLLEVAQQANLAQTMAELVQLVKNRGVQFDKMTMAEATAIANSWKKPGQGQKGGDSGRMPGV